ncbi:hypothetical protein [Paenibacillus oenotherae]|uniref:hypothetical protein n=1 Tax=Paenibacillus oenotherae TaxID=1435645 RepID=UPI001FE261BC|nr:hypothetical protein [Paenibacillus oenotherae]
MGPEGTHPMVGHFLRWWKQAALYWLHEAEPGDVLLFVCEIGHHYAVTPNYLPGNSWEEHFDRWEQSIVMKKLAERVWSEVSAAAGKTTNMI